jgi:hypothetical protein
MTKIGGIDYSNPMSAEELAPLVADIVAAKLAGNYENIEAEVIGGWSISIQDQMTQSAELIADAVVEEIGVKVC